MVQHMPLLRCTVADPDEAVAHDVELLVHPTTTVRSLLASLPVDVGSRPVYAGTDLLDPSDTFATSALTAGVVLTVGMPGTSQRHIPDGAAGVLQVLTGPHRGRWTWLTEGRAAIIGRGAAVDLTLQDTKVSRRHAEVVLTDDGLAVTDQKSTNGTKVLGTRLTDTVSLPEGGTFEVGQSVLQWLPLDKVQRDWRRTPEGRIAFTRRFHHAQAPARQPVDLPSPVATTGRSTATMAVSLAAPAVIGLIMALVTGRWYYLLIALLSPLTVGVQQVFERRTRHEEKRRYEGKKADAVAEIAQAVTDEEQVRRINDPDETVLRLYALGALPGLWTKKRGAPDALTVRVGVRDEAAAVELRGERWDDLDPRLRAVPVTVDLRATGVLGVAGDAGRREGLARWLVLQLATRRSPEDLALVVLSSGDGDGLRWTRWLPHLDAGDDSDVPCRVATTTETRKERIKELLRLIEQRDKARQKASGPVHFDSDVIVVLDGASELRQLDGMRDVLSRGPDVGVYGLCLDETDISECRGTIDVDAKGTLTVRRTFADRPDSALAESTRIEDAEHVARLLAPMRDRAPSGGGSAIPYPVRFLDLVKIGRPAADDVLRIWGENPGPTMRVPLGADAQETVRVDFAEQGPHTMLGGATGAGKSFLLQAVVASLLLHNRPDELNLLLVDFKGGAAFRPFVLPPEDEDAEGGAQERSPFTWAPRCPHVVGLITSTEDDPSTTFDKTAADRVLASVRREVARRESLLARYGGEIDNYLRDRPSGAPPLPRLLMVFDEFARVLDAAPGFMLQLVNVAGKGRSLGMHLLVATQSLQNKLTPELKNNIDLRISLRQNEVGESNEVLDVPDATQIPGRLRGRGLILSKKDEPPTPRPFQSGFLGAPPPSSEPPPARARILEWSALGDRRPADEQRRVKEETDQDLLITAIEDAARTEKVPPQFRPVLPPLPGSLTLGDLAKVATEPAPPQSVPYGLADLPADQAQPEEHLPLTGAERLMIAGGAESGRTTALRTLIHAAADRFSADDLHLYVVEKEPAGLSAYESLPHCGGVFGPSEPDRIRRFVTWLGEEVGRRTVAQFTVTEEPPTLLLLVDGWELFHDPTDQASVETSLVRILREVIKGGPKVGVRMVVSCGRGPFATKPADLFDRRLVLRFPGADIVKAALPPGTPLPLSLPGRAADAATGRHIQIALPDESAQDFTARVAHDCTPPVRAPRHFPSLDPQVDVSRVARPEDATAGWVPLGLGGPELEPFGVDLFAGPQMLLVSGPAGSGRSTAAAVAVSELARQGVGCVVLCPPRSPLVQLVAGVRNVSVLVGPTLTDDVVRQAAAALETPQVVVVADDCEQLTVVPTTKSFEEQPTLLAEATTPDRLGRMGLVLCGNAMPLLDGRRSLSAVARRVLDEGARVLLTPAQPAVAREHRILLEADQYLAGPPGRGYLAVGRRQNLLQLITCAFGR